MLYNARATIRLGNTFHISCSQKTTATDILSQISVPWWPHKRRQHLEPFPHRVFVGCVGQQDGVGRGKQKGMGAYILVILSLIQKKWIQLRGICFCWGSFPSMIKSLLHIIEGFPGSSALPVRIHLQCRRPQFISWVRMIHWGTDRLPTPVFVGFPGGSDGKESACNAGDVILIPGSGGFLWRNLCMSYVCNPLQDSCLENPMDRGAWRATVHGSQRVGHGWVTERST